MTSDIFVVGIDSEEEVLAVRAVAKANILAGTIITNWSSQGTSVNKTITMDTAELLRQCNRFLREVNPDLYGRLVTRTRPYYT